MDPLLPFRALSPRTHKPKITQRNRDTKLSLRKPAPAMRNVKEKNPPPTVSRWRKHNSNLTDSDLMTSDESHSSGSEVKTLDSRRNSVMTVNSQESTFSIPVAESTRCEPPSKKTTHHVESPTVAPCSANSGSSSESPDYVTACPLSVGCDDSVVYVSDSSPEAERKVGSKALSVLLTSDDSDTELRTNYLHQNVLSQIRQGGRRRLCDTVVLETSHSDDSIVDNRPDCGIEIPPSIKSDTESCCSNDSAACCIRSTSSEIHVNVGVTVPPTRGSSKHEASRSVVDSSLISEDGAFGKELSRKTTTYQDGSHVPKNHKRDKIGMLDGNTSTDNEPNDSSWKADFHLVLQDSHSEATSNSGHSGALKILPPTQELGTISKEKYNDIARWLFSGNDSPGSTSEPCLHLVKNLDPGLNPDIRAPASSSDDVPRASRPQAKRPSIVKKSSFGSESDDNFDALMKSTQTKLHEKVRKGKTKASKDDSFIDDTGDADESSPFVYHSELTKSIRKEVKSVQKSVKNIKKTYIRYQQNDSSDESDEEQPGSPVLKPAVTSKINFKSVRIHHVTDSDDSNSEPFVQPRNEKTAVCEDSDLEPKLPRSGKLLKNNDLDYAFDRPKLHSLKTSKTTKGKGNESRNKSLSLCESSGSSSSDTEPSIPARIPLWRKGGNSYGSVSGSSTSSDAQDKVPKGREEKNMPTKLFKKPIGVGERRPVNTPKTVAALKSPRTPYSPIRTFLSSLSGPSHVPGIRDHPEVAVYNKNFKAKKEELTRRLFKLFNREVFDYKLPGDLLLEWNTRLIRTAGLCYCKLVRKSGTTTRTANIALSTKVITSPDRLRDTLIHEMCHAAVWLLNNVSGGHGPFWKAWAFKAMKRFPELPPIERCHSYKIETKFTYKCTKCGYSFGRHSKSLDLEKKRCGYCYSKFEVFLSAKGQEHNKMLKTPKAPSAFALFVKENYGLVKQENSVLKHGDIMKKLGENFSAMKVKNSGN